MSTKRSGVGRDRACCWCRRGGRISTTCGTTRGGIATRRRCGRRRWPSARRVLEWPTDGIATVRPNLGVTFIPAMAGVGCQVQEGAMPWPGGALGRDTIRWLRR